MDGHKDWEHPFTDLCPWMPTELFSPPYDNNEIFPGPVFADGKNHAGLEPLI